LFSFVFCETQNNVFVFLYHLSFVQLASITLKQFVKEHWQPDDNDEDDEEQATSTMSKQSSSSSLSATKKEISEEEKKLIREILQRGLSESNVQIRTSIAMVISLIASTDWPLKWNLLIEQLTQALQSSNINLVKVKQTKKETKKQRNKERKKERTSMTFLRCHFFV
jgi:hypothetical protein